MSRKTTTCATAEPVTKAGQVNPVCTGTVVPVEFPITIAGIAYTRYEKCQRCGKIYPG